MASNLILHCGGKPVTFEELGGFEIPHETKSYMPVAHQDLVRLAEQRTRLELDYDGPIEWQHAVNKEGRQYFGVAKLTSKMLTDLQCLCMGLRNSYDKSMKGAVAYGGGLFICDNLAFWGSLITVMRKHTKNIMRDLRRLFVEALENVMEDAKMQAEAIEAWKDIKCFQSRGYEIIGLMRGYGLLTPNISNLVFKEWQKPRYPEFEGRNLWSLYNATTEGLKAVAPSRALKTYAGVHTFFKDELVDPSVVEVAYTAE